MKGSYFILESIIAIMIMVTSVAFVLQKPPENIEMSYMNYKQNAYNGLKILEQVGDLRKNILDNDSTSIKNDLATYIKVSYGVTIFKQTTNLTAIPSIDSKNILIVSYFIAGKSGTYIPRELRIYMWGV